MGKHSPPPKSKHVNQFNSKSSARYGAAVNKQVSKKIYVHQFSAGAAVAVSAAAVLLGVALFLPLEGWYRLAAFALPWLIAAAGAVKHAAERALGGDILEEDLIMTAASIAAFCIGKYPEGAAIMVLYRVCELLVAYVSGKSRQAAAELMNVDFDNVNVVRQGGVISMRPQDVAVGEHIVVAPGERIPLDGIVTDGMTSVDASLLTGETMPLTAAPGSKVISGCINLTNYIKVSVTSTFKDSTAARLTQLLREAGVKRSGRENQVIRFAGVYTPLILVLALIFGVILPIFSGEWVNCIGKAIIFLVISCPYALVEAVTMPYFGGLASASHCGIFIKGTNFLEILSKAETMVFDKTGTITEGRFSILDVYPEKVSERELLLIAAKAEYYSAHPIAVMLRTATAVQKTEDDDIMQVEELPGYGISAFVNGQHVYVGNAALLEEHGIRYTVPKRSGAAIHVSVDNEYWGYILISDKLRDGAFDALESIRHFGVRNMVLLTGDVRSVSRPIASSLNFDMVKAELQPDGKVSAVEYLMATKGDNSTLAFIGDSDNDSAALTRADVGIAFGSLCSMSAIQNADVLFMGEDIRRLPTVMKTACQSAGIANQNIAAIMAIKLIVLFLGMFGVMPIAAAAFCESAALIAAMINTLRTFRFLKTEEKK